jgi:hypothetical protein
MLEKTEEATMKMLVIGAALGATLLGALPATAQVVVRERGDAVVVHRDHYDRGRHYGWYRGHHYGWRSHADCRTVRVKTRTPSGDVIIRTRRTC